MDLLPYLHSEMTTLAAEILALSGLWRVQLEDAATELSIGIELCCGGPDADPDGMIDPYDEFQAFARDPGLDYENVEDSEIADLSSRQKALAVAWHYVQFAKLLINPDCHRSSSEDLRDLPAHAQKLKLAARKPIEDSVGHYPSGSEDVAAIDHARIRSLQTATCHVVEDPRIHRPTLPEYAPM